MESSFGILFLLEIVIVIVALAAMWKVYAKANQPGWAAIIPIYNIYILLKIAGKPGWWLLLYFIPIVNIIITIMVAIDLAKAFGKSSAFGVIGLWLFSIIGYMILGFGSSKYIGVSQKPQSPIQPQVQVQPSPVPPQAPVQAQPATPPATN